ncbi:unnamed protein product [Vitrella brassicaformis CCMP3155]|uniref:G-patch domain-containing protein n=3 Tax=Vitrella brassicaformis TaxID=1169539 RepID=A0A0G4ERL5_VITBC|nr:unnamed protein product [Vitrella brassicaformis CCMP3155]|eukprot:CEM00674.1 unnamed protein product [Vitrella brassicaformis CCMP3155]
MAEEGMMSFSMEGDFEGGEFDEQGEFWFRSKKQKKRLSKEQAIYGVFYDEAASSDEEDKSYKRRKMAEVGSAVRFVSKGSVGGTIHETTKPQTRPSPSPLNPDQDSEPEEDTDGQPPEGEEDRGGGGGEQREDEDDDEIDPRFQFKDKSAAEEGVDSAADAAGGSKQKHTWGQQKMSKEYGVGFKLLQKMGYKGGGLGKGGSGRVNPVEVRLRQKGRALQDTGEKIHENEHDGHKPPTKSAVEILLGSGDKAGASSDRTKVSDGWKASRGKKGGPKKVYRTVAEIAEETRGAPGVLGEAVGAGRSSSMRILDMTGPEARVLDASAGVGGVTVAPVAVAKEDEKLPLKELRYNLRVTVLALEREVMSVARDRKQQQDALLNMSHEKEQLAKGAEMIEDEAIHMEAILDRLSGCKVRLADGTMSLAELTSEFRQIQRDYPHEYVAHSIPAVGLSFVFPALRAVYQDWQPLADPTRGVAELQQWAGLCGAEGLARVTDELIVPCIRSCVTNVWLVREVEGMVKLVESWQPLLPVGVFQSLLTEGILPRLVAEVEAWNPRTDPVPIHTWVHPWLPIMGPLLEGLWAPIRFKVALCLQHWHPADRSAVHMLKPWRDVMDAANWGQLMLRSVMPKLRDQLTTMQVRPDSQSLAPLQNVFAWLDVAPLDAIVALLETHFIPQWLQALQVWISTPGADPEEMMKWYQGWKTVFPEALLTQPRIQQGFMQAVHMMKAFATQSTTPPAAPPPPPPPPPSEPPPPTPEDRLAAASFREYLEQVASENDLLMRPKVGRIVNGKQVHAFGRVSLYLDQNVTFVLQGGEWKAVSVEALLDMAKKGKISRAGGGAWCGVV